MYFNLKNKIPHGNEIYVEEKRSKYTWIYINIAKMLRTLAIFYTKLLNNVK